MCIGLFSAITDFNMVQIIQYKVTTKITLKLYRVRRRKNYKYFMKIILERSFKEFCTFVSLSNLICLRRKKN